MTLLAINAFSEQLELQEELDKYTEKIIRCKDDTIINNYNFVDMCI